MQIIFLQLKSPKKEKEKGNVNLDSQMLGSNFCHRLLNLYIVDNFTQKSH